MCPYVSVFLEKLLIFGKNVLIMFFGRNVSRKLTAVYNNRAED